MAILPELTRCQDFLEASSQVSHYDLCYFQEVYEEKQEYLDLDDQEDLVVIYISFLSHGPI